MSGPLTERGMWIRADCKVRKKKKTNKAEQAETQKHMILICRIILKSRMSAAEIQIDELRWHTFSHNGLFIECNSYRKWHTISNYNAVSVEKKGWKASRVSPLKPPPHIYISMAADGVAMGGGSAIWQMMGNGQRWRAFPNFSVQTNRAVSL